MAYSPTPHSSTMPSASHAGGSNPFYRHERRSASPPTQQPAINKRDKRRMMLQDRLAEISQNFAENRDANYRKQLQQYQADLNFINNAQLYGDRPLLEPGGDDGDESNVNGLRQQQLTLLNGNSRIEGQPKTGRHAAKFLQEINDAMEERDANLTAAAYNFNFVIEQYEKDYKFAVEIAQIEHQRLLKSLRQQLISNVQQKKVALSREKEKLDIADTNALLHYPNQFSMNNTASPGGPQSNRKTRHTRHRLDIDDLDTAINNSTNNGKRKRKAIADTETGSPGPVQVREAEFSHGNGYKDSRPRLDVTHAATQSYTINRLFTDRELNANLQQTTYEVIASRTAASNGASNSNGSKRRKQSLGGGPPTTTMTDSLLPITTTDPTTDLEDNLSTTGNPAPTDTNNLDITDTAAIAMDRTPSQLYHATRSAGRLQSSTTNLNTTDPRQTYGELAGRQSAADLIGSYTLGRSGNEKLKKADGDDYQRAPPLSEMEAAEDVRLMERAIRRMEAGRGKGGGGVEDDEDEQGVEDEDGDIVMSSTTAAAGAGGAAGEYLKGAAGFERKILELAVGEEKRDWIGPVGFGQT